MKFVPCSQLEGVPNIIVDGARTATTVLSLSHWPKSGTPSEFKDDLSAQIVFHYLDRPDLHVTANVVSNDHFDEDGLVSIHSLVNPEHALKNREVLIDLAAAGDFGTYRLRDAARAAFVISAHVDKNTSPFPAEVFQKPYPEMAAELYLRLLPMVPEIIDNIEQYRNWWQNEDEFLTDSEEKIKSGQIIIEEFPELDLSIVTLPNLESTNYAHRFTQGRSAWCHPMAVNNATKGFRTLLLKGRQYEFQYRYESWVQYISRRPLPRIEMHQLAESLTKQEDDGVWKFDGVSKITPSLKLTVANESKISPEDFRTQVIAYLQSEPPSWDPYD